MYIIHVYIWIKSCAQQVSTKETTHSTTHIQPHTQNNKNILFFKNRNSQNGLETLMATIA